MEEVEDDPFLICFLSQKTTVVQTTVLQTPYYYPGTVTQLPSNLTSCSHKLIHRSTKKISLKEKKIGFTIEIGAKIIYFKKKPLYLISPSYLIKRFQTPALPHPY